MLVELRLVDFALFEEAEIVLGPGLNAITGETGAGKSLIVGALQLLLGQRARPRPWSSMKWMRGSAVA
jgi:DNA repair protein RecN (Recombination protein N)